MDAFKGFWAEYEEKHQKASDEEARETMIKAAMDKYDAPPTADVRNASDAMIKVIPADQATKGVMLADGKVVQFADQATEGWIKGYPASVQHPEIVRRLTPDLRGQAQEECDAFAKWFRYGRVIDEKDRKALARLKETKATTSGLQEDTDSEGGYLVPSDMVRLPVIIKEGVPFGVTRPISSVFTTTRDSGTFPASSDDLAWVGVAEEAAFTASNPVLSEVPFTIRKIGLLNKVSMELLEDSAVDIASLLGTLFLRSLGRYEDQQSIEGDGVSEPTGLRTPGGAGTITTDTDRFTAAAPTAAEALGAFFNLPAQWRANASWHMTSGNFAKFAAINSTTSGITTWDLLGREPTPRMIGRPVAMFDGTGWDAYAASKIIGAIGDFSNYYFIDRVGMTVTRLNERFADNDQVGFKARKRFDSMFAVADAFRLLDTGS